MGGATGKAPPLRREGPIRTAHAHASSGSPPKRHGNGAGPGPSTD